MNISNKKKNKKKTPLFYEQKLLEIFIKLRRDENITFISFTKTKRYGLEIKGKAKYFRFHLKFL